MKKQAISPNTRRMKSAGAPYYARRVGMRARFFPSETAQFFQRFGFPFIILLLMGFIVYLGSIIGGMNAEEASIQALIDSSEPKSVLRLPSDVQAKKWATFRLGFGTVQFKYPKNWRVESSSDATLIREGENALISVETSNADASGGSMLAYRVARISALEDLGYPISDISKALVADQQALVLQYESEDGGMFYETTIIHRGVFYTIVLAVKNSAVSGDADAITQEYKEMLATVMY